jgi:hypothetical protein
MPNFELFPRQKIIGVFRGFREGGLEFHADLVLPYKNEFQNLPMHGQFILVQLENPEEAVLGRIASLSSEGKLSAGIGEEFNIRAMRESRPIPEDLREQYLKYKINIRVLGVLRNNNENLTFVASHRRLPHVGSPVAFPSNSVLQEIAGHNIAGAEIGHLAFGEYVYAHQDQKFEKQDWMQIQPLKVCVKFPIDSLVSRRSFIFARAGFGKSNLNKLLFSKLYESTPFVTKRGGKKVAVGTVLFDPDGEYFWPDDKGRPGLCDVSGLKDKLVVFTSRKNPSPYYQSYIAGGIKLDIRRLQPSDVVAIAISPEKQDQQNIRKLRGLNQRIWTELVDIIDEHGHQAPLEDIRRLLDLEERQEAEALAARANATAIVRMLHDKSSQLMDMLIEALSNGKLCVIDVSQLRGGQAMVLSGLILRRIFDRNQEEFTSADPKTIPTIAVIEEAQTVLNEKSISAEPFIAWVKEGRKYDLGAVMVTQQPGSIPIEILSQGDNWFIFHLLASADLMNVKRANAHFSEDLLSALLNEPIPGQGTFWSSVGGKPYPVPIRVLSFEKIYQPIDLEYKRPAEDTYAKKLKSKFDSYIPVSSLNEANINQDVGNDNELENPPDILHLIEQRAIEALKQNIDMITKIRTKGVPWGGLISYLANQLPDTIDNARDVAHNLIPKALTELFGEQNDGWHSFKNPSTGATWIKAGKEEI